MIIVCRGSVQALKLCKCTMMSGLCEVSVKEYAYVKKDFDIGNKSNGQQPTTDRERQWQTQKDTQTHSASPEQSPTLKIAQSSFQVAALFTKTKKEVAISTAKRTSGETTRARIHASNILALLMST